MTSPSPHGKAIPMPPPDPGPTELLSPETSLGSSAPLSGLRPPRSHTDFFKTMYTVLSLRQELF